MRSPPRTSTRGRAPVFSMIIRFWMSVDSLNRPPTLLTIASSFRSSSTASLLRGKKSRNQPPQLGDGGREVVIDYHAVVLADPFQFAARGAQATGDGRLVVRAPRPQAPFVF